jgi:tetratricopeptide (TPR) repeat protein
MRTRTFVFALVASLLLTGCLPGSVRRYLAEEHRRLGWDARQQGRYDEAIHQFRMGLEFVPTGSMGAELHIDIGQVLELKQDYPGATQEMRTAVALQPKMARAHSNLGWVLLQQKDFDAGIAEYRAASDLDPNDVDARLALGRAYAAKGDHDGAITQFQKAVDAHPNSGLAHVEMAMEYNRVKDYARAIEQYKAAIADDPSDATTWNNLAWIYATAENLKYRDPVLALSNAERAVKMEPEVGYIHDTYAEALYVNGKYADAVRVQEETLKMLRPTDDPKDYIARLEKYKAAAKKKGSAG